MTSETFPVIDLSSHEDWPQALGPEIVQACKEWGFMVITGHGIPHESIGSMFEMHQQFCQLPESVKSEKVIDARQIGYDVKRSSIAVNECMVFGGTKGDILKGDNLHSWWDLEKRQKVEDFKAKSNDLALELLRVFATSFGLEPDYFSSAHQSDEGPGNVLRMLHYPKLNERPDKNFPRLYSHTDWGSLTFVWPRGGGLEVETPSKEWMAVPVIPGSVVVNVGDALSLWSGQALKSTLHKISFDNLPFDQDRWSMAYFVNANKEAKLEILQKGENGKLLAPSDANCTLTAGDYHLARLYMSQKEDAKNNWIGNAGDEMKKSAQRLAKAVESLGVANGSGMLDFSSVKGLM